MFLFIFLKKIRFDFKAIFQKFIHFLKVWHTNDDIYMCMYMFELKCLFVNVGLLRVPKNIQDIVFAS